MAVSLKRALMEILTDWPLDRPPQWRGACGEVELGNADPRLEFREPVFPVRRAGNFTGMPVGAHMLRAFEGIPPHDVRCVIGGRNPYPAPDFATGRAFEAGNAGSWRELDKMFSKSVRAFIQQIVAARTGHSGYARNFANWPKTLAAVESGAVALEPASQLAQRWVDGGVLLLNASLTLSRLRVYVDPHQPRGHLALWALLVVIGFGDLAAETLWQAGLREGRAATHAFCAIIPLTRCSRSRPALSQSVPALSGRGTSRLHAAHRPAAPGKPGRDHLALVRSDGAAPNPGELLADRTRPAHHDRLPHSARGHRAIGVRSLSRPRTCAGTGDRDRRRARRMAARQRDDHLPSRRHLQDGQGRPRRAPEDAERRSVARGGRFGRADHFQRQDQRPGDHDRRKNTPSSLWGKRRDRGAPHLYVSARSGGHLAGEIRGRGAAHPEAASQHVSRHLSLRPPAQRC
jgi:uracil-DNA glycosylase